MNCAKAGCNQSIKVVKDGDYEFYVHTKEPVSHTAQVQLAKGPA
jgi:hypothetical protein